MTYLTDIEWRNMLVQSCDLTIELGSDLRVLGIQGAKDLDASVVLAWTGARLDEIVGDDSLAKIDALLADNAADAACEGRWRHLNFNAPDADAIADIPLLLKCFSFETRAGRRTILCARDLRPMAEIQRVFLEQLRRLEQRLERSESVQLKTR